MSRLPKLPSSGLSQGGRDGWFLLFNEDDPSITRPAHSPHGSAPHAGEVELPEEKVATCSIRMTALVVRFPDRNVAVIPLIERNG
jgi:hypothetical protein